MEQDGLNMLLTYPLTCRAGCLYVTAPCLNVCLQKKALIKTYESIYNAFAPVADTRESWRETAAAWQLILSQSRHCPDTYQSQAANVFYDGHLLLLHPTP